MSLSINVSTVAMPQSPCLQQRQNENLIHIKTSGRWREGGECQLEKDLSHPKNKTKKEKKRKFLIMVLGTRRER